MASFLSALKTIASIIAAIPSILRLIREINAALDAVAAEKRRKEEIVRQEKMQKVGNDLKDAIKKGNEDEIDKALGDIVSDYNRRS